jgi:hypothetical protein
MGFVLEMASASRRALSLGIVTTGNWCMQDPLLSGEAGAFAYLPSQKVAIGLALTFSQDAFAADGSYSRRSPRTPPIRSGGRSPPSSHRTTHLRPRSSTR